MKKQLVIRCRDKCYGELLAEYIRKHFQNYFEVATGDVEYDLLLMEEMDGEDAFEVGANEYVLSNERRKENHFIYRYQCADGMMKELLYKSDMMIPGEEGKESRIILFYSPGGNEIQSKVARSYASVLGKKEKVLYLFYGDFFDMGEEAMESAFDLSQLCFLIMQEGVESITSAKILASTTRMEDYDVLKPFTTPIHAAEVTDEIAQLILQIQSLGLYEVILCDFQQLPLELSLLKDEIAEINVVSPVNEACQLAFQRMYQSFLRYLEQQGIEAKNIMMKERKSEIGGVQI